MNDERKKWPVPVGGWAGVGTGMSGGFGRMAG